MTVEIRPIVQEQLAEFQKAMGVPFGFDPNAEMLERFKRTFELDRLRAAFDGDQIVGTFGAFSFELTVPGGNLPMAGTTVVTVLPTHRRQGILRKMMADHFRELRETGESIAALWASESNIYGRFGYGPATEMVEAEIAKPYAKLVDPPNVAGTMRLIDREEAQRVFPPIYESVAKRRAGMYLRSEKWWRERVLSDPENRRHGSTAHRRALHTRGETPAGYAIFRTNTDRSSDTSKVKVVELTAIDAEAERSLWQFLFGIDLADSIGYWNLPVVSPLNWWLEQPRRLERKVEDALWLRPIDVVKALNGRRYPVAGSVTFRMRDALCEWNDGVYRLDADDSGVGTCVPDKGEPQIDLTPFALGSVYLGGHRVLDLAEAGVVTGEESALRQADAMFGWHRAPWCQEIF